jgi:hypothetical protein
MPPPWMQKPWKQGLPMLLVRRRAMEIFSSSMGLCL